MLHSNLEAGKLIKAYSFQHDEIWWIMIGELLLLVSVSTLSFLCNHATGRTQTWDKPYGAQPRPLGHLTLVPLCLCSVLR